MKITELIALACAVTAGSVAFNMMSRYMDSYRAQYREYMRDQQAIVARFGALPFLAPDRHDHFEAAQIRNRARRRGVQIGTIDAVTLSTPGSAASSSSARSKSARERSGL